MTQLEFLEDTASFYNLINRSYDGNKGCRYEPPHDKSPGCAIGRYLTTEVQKKYDQSKGWTNIKAQMSDEKAKKMAPEWMQEMNPDFLIRIQNLHDMRECWTETGISETGKRHVQAIKIEFNL